jgi:hypothetical protein
MMNRYSGYYQAVQRGSGTFADSVIGPIVFRTKLSVLMKLITHHQVIGEVLAFVWRIESQKRDLRNGYVLFWTIFENQDISAAETVISVRYPKDSRCPTQNGMVANFQQLINSHQVHHDSEECPLCEAKCRFGYQQEKSDQTRINDMEFKKFIDSQNDSEFEWFMGG